MKCVFLGYFRLHRGYHCYSPNTNRYFISTDVTFFENSFFFPVEHPSVPDVLSIPFVLPSPDFPSPPIDVVTRLLQVYTRHPPPPTGPHVDSSIMSQSFIALVPQPSDDLPIVIRKGTRSTSNPHPVYNFLSFHRLSLPYFAFVSTLSSISTPKNTSDALSHPGWKQEIDEEMDALYSNDTWELVALPLGKSLVGYSWVYTVKVALDGQIDRLKALLVAKGYTQQYSSRMHKPNYNQRETCQECISMVTMHSWPLFQLDIKNAFLHGNLVEEVYMEQPPGFVAQGESGLVCELRRSLYCLKQSPQA